MFFDSRIHNRQSMRLLGGDYSQEGIYFITICTHNREYLFGEIKNEKMFLNEFGKIVKKYWEEIPNHYQFAVLDEYIVMPNHIHGVIQLVGAGLVPAQNILDTSGINRATTRVAPTIGNIIGRLKSLIANEYIFNVKSGEFPPFKKRIFQRNYYDHIIRDKFDLNNIRDYIRNNPLNWENDRNYRRDGKR